MNKIVNYLLNKELEHISNHISELLNGNFSESNNLNIETINSNLLNVNETNISFIIHKKFINSLITIYLNSEFTSNLTELKELFDYDDLQQSDKEIGLFVKRLPEILEELHIVYLNSIIKIKNGKLERTKSKQHLRETGSVYTLKSIANGMVDNCINYHLLNVGNLNGLKCLDFASGTGRFYFEAAYILKNKYNFNINEIICNILFAIDIDQIAINILKVKALSLLDKITVNAIKSISKNIIVKNALIPKTGFIQSDKTEFDFGTDFKSPFEKGGFDIIFSNPPYFLLKVNNREGKKELNAYNSDLKTKINSELHFFRNSGIYKYSIEGMLNYYQLSIEMMLLLTNKKGQLAIICPSSIFADLTSRKLREHILVNHKIQYIKYFNEGDKLFENVSQSTVIFHLLKGGITDNIELEIKDKKFQIHIENLKSIFPKGMEIPFIENTGWTVLKKLAKFKKLGEIDFIRNRRGELDLTLFKNLITKNDTGWRLVRGNMITHEGLKNRNNEYVEIELFKAKKTTDYLVNDLNRERLVCQQISNIDRQNRLLFVFCNENDIIGNSCNYLVSKRGLEDLRKLKYLLNSSLMNWRFKITSSNNHINNYELDELPIINLDNITLNDFSDKNDINDEIIFKLYGLNEKEKSFILNQNK